MYMSRNIEAERRKYAWPKQANMRSDIGLSPDRHDAIFWTHSD